MEDLQRRDASRTLGVTLGKCKASSSWVCHSEAMYLEESLWCWRLTLCWHRRRLMSLDLIFYQWNRFLLESSLQRALVDLNLVYLAIHVEFLLLRWGINKLVLIGCIIIFDVPGVELEPSSSMLLWARVISTSGASSPNKPLIIRVGNCSQVCQLELPSHSKRNHFFYMFREEELVIIQLLEPPVQKPKIKREDMMKVYSELNNKKIEDTHVQNIRPN